MIPHIPIKRVMSSRLITVDYQDDLMSAARTMAAQEVGSLLVTRGGEIVGIVTEMDIVRRVLAHNLDLSAVRVEEVMSYPVHSLDEEESLERAHEAMGEHHIRHILVTRKGEPVGMISVRNILESIYESASQSNP